MEFPPYSPPCTRAQALDWAHEFSPQMGPDYAKNRNRVVRGHPFVSRLAPSIRVRLMAEPEVADIALKRFGALSPTEKFIQEVHWRDYWRSWMELHPEVWKNYLKERDATSTQVSRAQKKRLQQVENGESGVEVMDKFARELVETGFLHNHARMWFAAFWIHNEKLPMVLGADFFERHLICACPSANTLSWRWVAGVQTRGKAYLARRSNLEKYCDEFYLDDLSGIQRLENPQAVLYSHTNLGALDAPHSITTLPLQAGKTGLWIHEDDFAPETSILRNMDVHAIGVSLVGAPQAGEHSNGLRRQFRLRAARDAVARARETWGLSASLWPDFSAAVLAGWARENGLQTVVCLKPFVGPTADLLPEIEDHFAQNGVRFHALRRERDAQLLKFAGAGFFRFWQGAKTLLQA